MQKVIQYIFKTFFKGLIISLSIAAVFIFIEIVSGRKIELDQQFGIELLYYISYGVTLTYLHDSFFNYMNHRVKWSSKMMKFRIVLGVLGSVVITVVGVFFIRMALGMLVEGENFQTFLANQQLPHYVFTVFVALVIALIFHTIYFYKKAQETKVKEQKIIAGTASAKFESLKNQIDPHFLFNSLNVLSSLIEENPDNAQKFTSSLSKIYRYVLEQKDKDLVNVDEELAFAKTYMKLLKMRFENSVFYEVPEKSMNPEAKVVPLSLQLLLENTVKHNIASEKKPLYIRIYEENDYLIIENDYQKKEVLQDRKGVGLQNIINRYSIITNRKVKIEQTETVFKVSIPMLTKQIAIMETNNSTEQSIYLKAQKKVEDIKGFYGNLSTYIIVISGLAILNLVTSSAHLWFLYPAIGWGIGVVIHGMSVFNYMPFLGSNWEERKIQELMNKDKADKWS